MAGRLPVEFRLDDRLTLRRKHPCGGMTWRVVRIGADIGLACDGCGHRVLLARRQLESRLVRLERAPSEAGE